MLHSSTPPFIFTLTKTPAHQQRGKKTTQVDNQCQEWVKYYLHDETLCRFIFNLTSGVIFWLTKPSSLTPGLSQEATVGDPQSSNALRQTPRLRTERANDLNFLLARTRAARHKLYQTNTNEDGINKQSKAHRVSSQKIWDNTRLRADECILLSQGPVGWTIHVALMDTGGNDITLW